MHSTEDEEEFSIVHPAKAFGDSLRITDMVESGPVSLSEADVQVGKNFCKAFVAKVVNTKLPEHLAKSEEITSLVKLHQSFEEFTLQAMFAVVTQAVAMLSQLTDDDMYNELGMLDIGKIQTRMQVQQHCMAIVQQFNLHIRRLPQAIADMVRDIEANRIIEAQVHDVTGASNDTYTSTKPLAMLMQEAEAEAERLSSEESDD